MTYNETYTEIALANDFSAEVGITVYDSHGLPYVTVLGEDGNIWLDRNIGATEAATSSTDANAYGYSYQWGRLSDGHEIPTSIPLAVVVSGSGTPSPNGVYYYAGTYNSVPYYKGPYGYIWYNGSTYWFISPTLGTQSSDFYLTSSNPTVPFSSFWVGQVGASGGATTTSPLSSTDVPGNPDFILAPLTPFDWRTPQNNSLWQGVNGINNPCPPGFRLPTNAEWSAYLTAAAITNAATAYASALKLTVNGRRNGTTGAIASAGSIGYYWASIVNGTNADIMEITSSTAISASTNRCYGCAVRAIKDSPSVTRSLVSLGRTLPESASVTDAILRTASRLFSEAASAADTLLKTLGRALSEAAVVADSLLRLAAKVLLETTSATATLVGQVGTALVQAVAVTDSVLTYSVRALSETAVVTDTVALIELVFTVLSEAATITDTLAAAVARVLSAAATVTDSLLMSTARWLSDVVSMADSILQAVKVTFSETFTILDSFYSAIEVVAAIKYYAVNSYYGVSRAVRLAVNWLITINKQ